MTNYRQGRVVERLKVSGGLEVKDASARRNRSKLPDIVVKGVRSATNHPPVPRDIRERVYQVALLMILRNILVWRDLIQNELGSFPHVVLLGLSLKEDGHIGNRVVTRLAIRVLVATLSVTANRGGVVEGYPAPLARNLFAGAIEMRGISQEAEVRSEMRTVSAGGFPCCSFDKQRASTRETYI